MASLRQWLLVVSTSWSIFAVLVFPSSSTTTTPSPKRGLAYIGTANPQDDSLLLTESGPGSHAGMSLTWYYDYSASPISNLPTSNKLNSLSFVPMQASTDGISSFPSAVTSQLAAGARLTHILTFNEPDGAVNTGGSGIPPSQAVKLWLEYLVPLRQPPHSLQIGLPSVTGSPRGLAWLSSFNTTCVHLSKQPKRDCNPDFVPAHWYGSLGGLQAYLSELTGRYPGVPIWVTELGIPAPYPLDQEQAYFHASLSYLDTLNTVERYAWFGAFRGDAAPGYVGANASFFSSGGKLTDLGSWYLGRNATGVLPLQGGQGAATSLRLQKGTAFIDSLAFLITWFAFWIWLGL